MFSASKSKGASSGYQIANSLRFRSSASAYLSRVITLSATWTLSLWVKRGKLGVTSPIFGSSVGFNSNDTLTAGTLTTTAVYRDPSSWYHIVVSNNGCYINGVSIGSVTTSILVNPSIGNYLTNYFDGYLTDIYLIDGSALSATSFGQFNATTGVWEPKQYAGSYGSAGFHLNFSNGTSTTTLGYDSSGNGNNWTTNNISLTAGITYDWMLDSPTPFQGSSYGVGNYAVLNPNDKALANITISNGNLTATGSATNYGVRGSFGVTSGSWYYEASFNGTAVPGIGIATSGWDLAYVGDASGTGNIAYMSNGIIYSNGVQVQTGLASYTSGDIVGVAYNVTSGSIQFYKNNVAIGTAVTGFAGLNIFPAVSTQTSTVVNVNFGQRPFSYTPPSGYKSLCTYNLPTPTIQNGAGYMAATLYTGNGSTQSIVNTVNGVSFAPDFVWIKSRGTADNHQLQDSVRGATKRLFSNLTDAESADATSLTSFNSNGFSLGNSTNYNGNGYSFVGWNWKAGGAAVTNTAGSITSSVSANTTSGFSVVTYTGTGANATVGHGLGVAPSMVIVKNRSVTTNWGVYHISLGASDTQYMLLNTAGAINQAGALALWNNTAPTSSLLSLGTQQTTNASANTFVAYCFAAIPGYSAFGSYTGNGSTDGPFVYCGFRPRFVLFKATNVAACNWIILDTSRNTYNVASTGLYPNLSNAEDSGWSVDINSNGFKLRDASDSLNKLSGTYIYAAFAENPFTNALAR